jgi:hypothetical protein
MRCSVVILLFMWMMAVGAWGQEPENWPQILPSIIDNGDTIPNARLPVVDVFAKASRKQKRDRANYDRLVYNVKKTLPYARIAASRIKEINEHLSTLKTEKEKDAYLKKAEKDMFAEFEAPLRKLTFSQGRILIKLIDRETGNTSYSLVKDYKGGMSAFFWQSVARIFGANLKDDYDEDGEDGMIEQIISQIDAGLL